MGPVESGVVDLIGAIYDSVLEPIGWPGALERIHRHFDLHNCVMGLNRFGYEPVTFTVSVNVPAKYQAMNGPEYGSEIIRMWGGPERVARHPIEEPVTLLSLTTEKALLDNKYYQDAGIPQGLIDTVAIVLTHDRRQVGNVAFGRHRDFGPVTDEVVAGLRVLAPHLRRAALITGILEEERKTRTTFEAVIDAVRWGIVLVDREARIVYANPAGTASMEAGEPLRRVHGKLEIRGEIVPGHLLLAVARAAEGDVPLGRRGIAIPGTRADGTPFVTHLLPLRERAERKGIPGEVVAAVFVADRDEDPDFAIDAATLVYGLTPTEARVLALIVQGQDSRDIATVLGITANTLKWHTAQLFGKTGSHRRADLVRLASQLRPRG